MEISLVSRRGLLVASAGCAAAMLCSYARGIAPATQPVGRIPDALAKQWLAAWRKRIIGESQDRACDKEMGEELGWLVSPLLNGFYYGYLATGDTVWLDRLVEMSDAWARRGVAEPDGFIGWPKADGASTAVMPGLFTDNILGEAMALRPMVMLIALVKDQPELRAQYALPAERYLKLAEATFDKWTARGCWRELAGGGGVWVVAPFGIEKDRWSVGYANRQTDGFTLPANKQNMVADWLIALHLATGKDVYRERVRRWCTTMKSRLRVRDGKFYVWNYWDPAGPWDYKRDGSTRHWVGVHPNGGYYVVDVATIISAYEQGIVFTDQDIARLIAINRDFMWDGRVQNATFKRIDGEPADERYKATAGVLWGSLIDYDSKLFEIFVANNKPDGWGAISETPKVLARHAQRAALKA